MRKYQPIWERIKRDKTAQIAAKPELHNRIITAVTKEKYKDIGWKLLLSEDGLNYKLYSKIEGKLITFYLKPAPFIASRNL